MANFRDTLEKMKNDDAPKKEVKKGKGALKTGAWIVGAIIGIAVLVAIVAGGKIAETYNRDEILCIVDPIDGETHWYFTAGTELQNFGTPIHWPKQAEVPFTKSIRFYDGGKADLIGSLLLEYPLTPASMDSLLEKFGNHAGVVNDLLDPILAKTAKHSGPLMSSKESYGERRNDLLWFLEDQLYGPYKTKPKDVKDIDILSGEEKTFTIVDIVMDENGQPLRVQEDQITPWGIKLKNFAIDEIAYEKVVKDQIADQQKAIMQVQTAAAQAKEAEQKAITIAKQGQAQADSIEWVQEAKRVAAQKRAELVLDSLKLMADAAKQYKIAKDLRAEADANYKKKVMAADGALQQKLDAWVEVNKEYAKAIKDYQGDWVSRVSMGTDGASSGGSEADDLIKLFKVKTANDISLDMSVPKGNKKGN